MNSIFYNELEIIILKNLCFVIGIEYERRFFSNLNWNTLHTWSIYERDCFNLWLCFFLRKHLHLNKIESEFASSYFIDKYGWKIGMRPEIAHGFIPIPAKQYKKIALRRYTNVKKT